ncbi:MAG: histidinol dehydrogenase [Candidatus Latescibacteria bacterium]|jgi:histidinol dehydrogenase|nr:histidinol dehydrogenase [Candidatus Latescibacterota bacterium]
MSILSVENLSGLSDERRAEILSRSMTDVSDVYTEMRDVVEDIARRGDTVSVEHYLKYKSDITAADITATKEEVRAAYGEVPADVVDALKRAAANIEKFHRAQLERDMWSIEIAPGIIAGRMFTAVEAAGCYVPGGTAAYPSSVLMNVIPARVAGVELVIACTPPKDGMVANPATLVAADIAGADAVYKIGGPWAIGSMACGTETVPKVDKIVGPGNKYVTAAKLAVFGRVDIDSPAGPSEVLILADGSPEPRLVAVDLLAQAEHDPDAAAVLVTTSTALATAVAEELDRILGEVDRRDAIERALRDNSALLVTDSMEDALAFTNEYAAEHLQVLTADPMADLPRIRHAGSIFLGRYSPVPCGDYASGTNHVLPTGQCARMFSGLSLDDFIKRPTFQYLTKDGLAALRKTVTDLARAEGLPMHARAVEERFAE